MGNKKELNCAGDLNVEVEEIKRMMAEKKEQDSENTFTRTCDALLTILCC